MKKYEHFSNGNISVYYNLDETKGDSWKQEFYSNGNIAKVYRKDGFEEYYDKIGNLILVYDNLEEKYLTFDRSFANGKFQFPCHDDLEKICELFIFKDGVLVN